MKQKLREKLILKRNKLKKNEVEQKSEIIAKNLFSLPKIKHFESFLIYMPVNNEVRTDRVIENLIKTGKKVFLTSYISKEKKYKIVKFTDFNKLEKGPFDILQPKKRVGVNIDNVDCAILPGVAFSRKGVRLGYGKGVFDQLLGKAEIFKIGLCFEFQVLDEVPKEKHDLIMNVVVTENEIIMN